MYSQAMESLDTWLPTCPTAYNIIYLHARAGITGLIGYAYLKTFLSPMLEKQWEDSWQGIATFSGDICQPKPLAHLAIASTLMYGMYQLIKQTACEDTYAASDDASKRNALLALLATLSGGLMLNRLFNAATQ